MEGERVTDWLADGVIKQHRTIGTLLNTLIGAGFSIQHVNEWGPTDAEVDGATGTGRRAGATDDAAGRRSELSVLRRHLYSLRIDHRTPVKKL